MLSIAIVNHRKAYKIVLLLLIGLLITCCSTSQENDKTHANLDTSISNLQLLNRISWGATPSSLEEINRLGAHKYIEQQLHPKPTPLPGFIAQRIANMEISKQSLAESIESAEQERKEIALGKNGDDSKKSRKDYQQYLNSLRQESAQRFILRAIYSPNQLQEQLTWFWFNHFSVLDRKNNIRSMIGDYEDQAIRPNVLGHFRDLLAATVYHPAMLSYLDNAKNTAGHINENYARELMELHTMGVDSGYSQTDVQELARILTGLGIAKKQKNNHNKKISYEKNSVVFNDTLHDTGQKQFLGEMIRGKGKAEIDEAIDKLSRHPATAHFISKKLAIYFMGDAPPPELVDRMAQTFLVKDGDISATLRTLFYSPEFSLSLNKAFKDPIHYVISATRLIYGEQPIENTLPIVTWLEKMGEPLYGRQTPDGYPLDQASWNSPGQMTTRFEIARTISSSNLGATKENNNMEAMSTKVNMTETNSAKINNTGISKPVSIQSTYYYEIMQHLLGEPTKNILLQSKKPQEWNSLFLSSPEFMNR